MAFQLGGAMSRVGEMETAFSGRSPAFDVNINGVWLPEGAEGASDHVAWVRSLFGELEPSARGVYVNFLGDEGADRERFARRIRDRLAEAGRRMGVAHAELFARVSPE